MNRAKSKHLVFTMALVLLILTACSDRAALSTSSSEAAEASPPAISVSTAPSQASSSESSSAPSSSVLEPSTPPSEPTEPASSQSEASQQQSSVPTHEQPPPEWNGYYERVAYNNQEYLRLGYSYEESKIGESLGEATALGLDTYKHILHKTTVEAFVIKDVSPAEEIAVQFEIEGEMQYIPCVVQPQSWYELEGVSDYAEQWHDTTVQPPDSLRFESYAAIAELPKLLKLSDSELEEIVQARELYYLRDRDFAESFLVAIESLYFPQIEGKAPAQIVAVPAQNHFYINYGVDGRAKYYFDLLMEPNSAGRMISGLQSNGVSLEEVTANFALPDGITVFARIKDADALTAERIPMQVFDLDVHGNYVRIEVVDAADLSDAITRLQEVSYARLALS